MDRPTATSSSEGRFSQRIRSLAPLIRLLIKTLPLAVGLLFVLYLIRALIPGTLTYLGKISLDLLVQAAKGNVEAIHNALLLLFVTASITLFNMVLVFGNSLTERYLATRFAREVDMLVIQKGQRLPLTFFDRHESYDQLQRARAGFGDRGVAVATSVLQIGSSIVTLFSFLMVTWLVSPWLPLALLPLEAWLLYLNMRWGQQRYQLARSQTPEQREVGYLSGILVGNEAAKEIRVFQLGPYLLNRWLAQYERVRLQMLSLATRQGISGIGSNVVNFGASFAAMVWLFFKMARGEISLGTYMAVSGAISGAIGLMPQVAASISQLYEQSLYVDDLFTYLDLPEAPQTGTLPFSENLRYGVSAENISFCYPETSKLVLRNISFRIKAGERVALVGENGSGKSTLVKCLLGLYQPDEGTICYDGIDVRDISPSSMRSHVTAVFQDFMHYAMTMRENVGFGNLPKLSDTDALDEVAVESQLADTVHGLPNGWDTKLGRMWAGGQELSIGQWQKVAIARALLRDANMIILDEPTASLDPKAEAAMVRQFMTATEGRTSLIVSHRLGTARMADRILVLKQGMLVEEGTHDELIRQNGEYARMFRLQAQWYQVDSAQDPGESFVQNAAGG